MSNFLPSFCFVVVTCAQLVAVLPAMAAVYYVSNSAGSDTNNGASISSPWKTLAKVNSKTFQPGDTIFFKRGDTWTKQNLKINSNGKSGQPITFAAYGTGDRPKLDGVFDASLFRGVYLQARSWLVLENLHFYRFNKGIRILDGSSNITVKNSHVSYINDECVSVTGNSSNVTIDANVIHDCGLGNNGEGVYIGTDPSRTGGVPDQTKNIIVKNNHIYNTGNEAIELKAGTSNCVVQNNHIHDVTEGYNGAVHAGHWGNPVIVPNHIIDGNIIRNIKGSGGFGVVVRSGGITLSRNIIYNTTQYGIRVRDREGTKLVAKIHNNTLVNNPLGSLETLDNAITDNKNNLPWANGSGNIGFNPLFVDASRGDFRLCDGVGSPVASCTGRSKAIDAGVNVGLSFSGTAPDLGAIESNLNSPPSAPTSLVVKAL